MSDTGAQTARDPKPTPERIIQLARRVLDADIVLPEFQRPFVWKRKQILELLDSIYKNFPIGSLLVWESTQKLESKRTIADLEVKERSDKYPVNYLLDGQQRLSTVCGVLYWEPGDPKSVWNVVFDLKTGRFSHVDTVDELPANLVALRRLANPSEYYKRLTVIDSEEQKFRADLLFNRFTDYQVALVTLGDMSINDVAPVFERINSTGTRLTIYDLMRAATWSPDFDLGKTVENIKSSLEPKRFEALDNKTFLRSLGAAAGGDFSAASMDALRSLDKDRLGSAADAMTKAALLAADFLSTEIGAPRAEALPYANQFAVLCEVFRVLPHPSSAQLSQIRFWFWKTTLSGYFSGWDNPQMAADATRIRQFAKGEIGTLHEDLALPGPALWLSKPFRSNSAVSKMLGLMLGHAGPVDLVNGQKIDVDKSLAWSNDKEFHHLFPQNFLTKRKQQPNYVANIVLLTSRSNIEIRDRAPSDYLREIANNVGSEALEDRCQRSLISSDALEAALGDDYDEFLHHRSLELQHHASALVGEHETNTPELPPEEVDDSDEDPTE